MVKATYISRPLQFTRPSGTSRGILVEKPCWYILLDADEGVSGIGEVSVIPGLSVEDPDEIEIQLDHVCKLISMGEMDPLQSLPSLPGIQFALECAVLDLKAGASRILFESDFSRGKAGIFTNGLIWMGDRSYMKEQISGKLDEGFRVLKMKVGALDIADELEILKWIRESYGPGDLEIRLDANGAWAPEAAREIMSQFAQFKIHSIEQPICAGQVEAMAKICSNPVIPVALDEELIGVSGRGSRFDLLEKIKPDFIILKPGLLGGFNETKQWIELAGKVGAAWWVTSALESSVGLSAIAQWTGFLKLSMPQGLGTGKIYRNNIPSPLHMKGERLWYNPARPWDLQAILHPATDHFPTEIPDK